MKRPERLRADLVQQLRVMRVLRSDAVADAFAAVPREQFIPEVAAERGLEAVYSDRAFVTKQDSHGLPLSSSSQPALMAKMLELLDLRPGQRVLEIGAGTGYNAALLAQLVGPRGRVTSIEVDPALARRARRALREAGARVSVAVGDGRRGWAQAAPYDRVIVSASADALPRSWIEQLDDGGLLVVPLRLDAGRGAIQVIPGFQRRGTHLRSLAFTWGGFMPLHGGDGGWTSAPATLSAHRSGTTRQGPLVSLSGPALSSLSEASAKALLAAVLAPSRPSATGTIAMSSAEPPLLLIYLLRKLPARRRLILQGDDRLGVGLMHHRTRSVAFISVQSPWSGHERHRDRGRWRLDRYGGDAAASELRHLLDQWEKLQRAGQRTLRITASGPEEALRLRFSWVPR